VGRRRPPFVASPSSMLAASATAVAVVGWRRPPLATSPSSMLASSSSPPLMAATAFGRSMAAPLRPWDSARDLRHVYPVDPSCSGGVARGDPKCLRFINYPSPCILRMDAGDGGVAVAVFLATLAPTTIKGVRGGHFFLLELRPPLATSPSSTLAASATVMAVVGQQRHPPLATSSSLTLAMSATVIAMVGQRHPPLVVSASLLRQRWSWPW